MVSINEDEREFVEQLIGIENKRKGYRDAFGFLKETGFPGKLLSLDENGEQIVDELESKGLVSSRTVNGEVMDVEDDEVSSQDSQKKYYSFNEELKELIEPEAGLEDDSLTDREKSFAQALLMLADTGFSAIEKEEKELPVSLAEMLDEDLDDEDRSSGLPSERFEEPMEILDSLRRKGLVRIRTDTKEKLTRDPRFSAEVGDDVYSLMETDYIVLTQELQERI